MIDYREALTRVLAQQFDWGSETVPLAAASGRVLRQPVRADRDQPPFDRVTMDGICINYAAYAAGRHHFPVARLQPAGTAPEPLTDPARCVEIMTGAALPDGATTVVRYEDLIRDGNGWQLPNGLENHRNIHYRGSDCRAGDLLTEPGRLIGPAEIALLATTGYATVEVARPPRVAVASTGDEIVAVSARPLPHQIRSSNVHQTAALLRTAGIEPTLAHLGDDADAGRRELAALIAGHDVVVLSGGVSKGKLDHVPQWLEAAGVRPLFHRVAQRPGKPIWVGRTTGTMVFALPGNPVSSLVGALAYLGPFLRQSLGVASTTESRVALAEAVNFRPDLTLFQLVSLATDPDSGLRRARPVRHAGSGDAASLLRGHGFLLLPRGRDNFPAGSIFPFLPLDKLL